MCAHAHLQWILIYGGAASPSVLVFNPFSLLYVLSSWDRMMEG